MWPRPATAALGGGAGERRSKDYSQATSRFVSATLGKLEADGRRAKSMPMSFSQGDSLLSWVGDAPLSWQSPPEVASPAAAVPMLSQTKHTGNRDECGSVMPVTRSQIQPHMEHCGEEEKSADKERSFLPVSISRATTATPGYDDTPRHGSPMPIFQRHGLPDNFAQAESLVASELHEDVERSNRARGSHRESIKMQLAEPLPSLNAAKLTALDSRAFASLNIERWRQAFREESQACVQAMQEVVTESKLDDITATFAEWRRVDRAELERLRNNVTELLRLNASLRQNQLDWLTRDEFSKLKQLLQKSLVPIMETSQTLKDITVALESEANSVAELRRQLADNRSNRIVDERNWERLMHRVESLQNGIAQLDAGKFLQAYKHENVSQARSMPIQPSVGHNSVEDCSRTSGWVAGSSLLHFPGSPTSQKPCESRSADGGERGASGKDNLEGLPKKVPDMVDALLLLQRVKTIESRGRVALGSLDGLVNLIKPINFVPRTKDLVCEEVDYDDGAPKQECCTFALEDRWAAQEVLRDALELASTLGSGLVIEGVCIADVCDLSSQVQAEARANLIKEQLLHLGADPGSLRCCEPSQIETQQAKGAQVVLKVDLFPRSES